MASNTPTRQGALDPHAAQDSVVVDDPSKDSLRMSADEADLSAIRLLDAASKARENQSRANGASSALSTRPRPSWTKSD